MSLRIETRTMGWGTLVMIAGVVDEQVDLAPLAALTGRVEVNLREVERINSFGARLWIEAVRKLADRVNLSFVDISPPVVGQLNMLEGFLGHATVRTFCAPVFCPSCDVRLTRVFAARDCLDLDVRLPPTACRQCDRPMELDDLEDQYLLFLREPTRVA